MNRARIGATIALATALAVAPAIATSAVAANPNCPRYDTGRISGNGATEITTVAPAGRVILGVCVKGEGEAYYEPFIQGGVYSLTFSSPSGSPIQHYSVDYSALSR